MQNKPRRTPVTSQTNEMENWKNRRAKNTKQKNRVFRIGGGKKNESLGTGRNNLVAMTKDIWGLNHKSTNSSQSIPL
jgi:hypothetical protein